MTLYAQMESPFECVDNHWTTHQVFPDLGFYNNKLLCKSIYVSEKIESDRMNAQECRTLTTTCMHDSCTCRSIACLSVYAQGWANGSQRANCGSTRISCGSWLRSDNNLLYYS